MFECTIQLFEAFQLCEPRFTHCQLKLDFGNGLLACNTASDREAMCILHLECIFGAFLFHVEPFDARPSRYLGKASHRQPNLTLLMFLSFCLASCFGRG